MPKLTKKQAAVYEFISSYMEEHRFAPSYREIAKHFGLSSPSTAHQHVEALIEKGYISRSDDGEARSLELIDQRNDTETSVMMLPLMGLITAGEPIEAVEDKETIAVPASFVVNEANSYVLKVKGRSMIEDGILDGDYVIVERNYYPENGDTVVALLNNENATLKRYYREKSRIRLQPANKTMKPIYARNPVIQGIVRGVLRHY